MTENRLADNSRDVSSLFHRQHPVPDAEKEGKDGGPLINEYQVDR